MDILCGVYSITCLVNQKIYIGSSSNIYKRWNNHRWLLKNNKHNNNYLQNAWNKYGEENFKFDIVELCNYGKQFELEQKYLDEKKPFAKHDNGFNFAENVITQYNKSNVEFFDYDELGMPHYLKERKCSVLMPITFDDYMYKSKKELQNEYNGYVMMLDIYDDMVMCDPDYI